MRTQGEVKWFDATKGYGFITCEEHARDIFVHESQILDERSYLIQQGQKVKFDIRQTERGLSAIKVIPATRQD
ncbi:MAG: cold shock domain-containing protein [Candidatus Poribacteria bacterium]|nr:cold shock domain-containing protein [Candidatus Poribacteria bacterium]